MNNKYLPYINLDMKAKNVIKKYIHILIPLILLFACALFLKTIDTGYFSAPDNELVFYIIIIALVIIPLICLFIELPGLIKSVKVCKQIDGDEPYSVKRRGVRFVLLHVGAMIFTVLWLVSMLYITLQFLQ